MVSIEGMNWQDLRDEFNFAPGFLHAIAQGETQPLPVWFSAHDQAQGGFE